MPANALQSPHSGRGSHFVSGFMPGTEHRVPVAVGSQQAFRFGEADHPGPEQVQGSFAIGTMNPSGVRGKEGLITELGQGIWCVAETQLSSVTAQSASKTMRIWPLCRIARSGPFMEHPPRSGRTVPGPEAGQV